MKSGKKLMKALWLLPVLIAAPAYFATAALTGQQVYDQYCGKCHTLGSYDTSGKRDLLRRGGQVDDKYTAGRKGHSGITLSSSDMTNLASFLNNPTTTVPLAVSTTSLPGGTVGTSYSQALAATGGKTPYTWSRSSGTLPTGLSLSSSGTISGTPSAAGTFSFTAKVTDAAAASVTKSLSITVTTGTPALSITTSSLPGGTAGTAYSQTLAATGGSSPYTWSYNGTLPPGITVTSGGVVSGTPTTAGSYSFTVLAVDTKSATATKALSVTIAAPASTPMSSADKNLFLTNCVACHTPSGLENRTASQIRTAITGNVGGMGTTQLKALTTSNLEGIARTLVPSTPQAISCDTCHSSSPPPTQGSGQGLYDADCAGCHKLSSYDTSGTAPDLYQSTRVDSYYTPGVSGHKGFTLSAADITNLKSFLNNPTANPPPPPPSGGGQAKYDSSCAGCHRMGSYDTSGTAPDLYQTTRVDSYYTAGQSGHRSITLTAQEIADLKTFFGSTTTPTPPPPTSCTSCHGNPPSTGSHSDHRSRSCSSCHGSGYSSTTVNAATHNNGVKNIVSNIGWNASNRTCSSNSCHGSESW